MPSDPPPQADYTEILRGLRATYIPGSTIEIRALNGQRFKADNGYFRDPITAANAIVHSDHAGRVGIYATMNSVDRDCYSRGADCITNLSGGFTNDTEIPALEWLVIDIDPKRRSGISATDTEKARASAIAQKLMDELHFLYGWTPTPILIDSGNGYHLKYRIGNLKNTPENVALIKAILYKLAESYDTDGVSIDVTCFNPSRIIRCAGTVARKGSHAPSEGRPHRLSRLLQEHDPFSVLSRVELERVATPLKGVNGHAILAANRYPPDEQLYRQLNRDALLQQHLDIWVPEILEAFNPKRLNSGVWRIDRESLGRDLEEDISFHPLAIKDMGMADQPGETRDGHRTPVEIVSMLVTGGDKRAAAYLIAGALHLPATPFERMPIGPPDAPESASELPPAPDAILPLTDATGGYKPALFTLEKAAMHCNAPDAIKPPFVPQWFDGVSLLVGDPKAGKSYLALQSAICITLGWPFLGSNTKQTDTWYITLEDDRPHTMQRMYNILQELCEQYGQDYESSKEYLLEHLYLYCTDTSDDAGLVTLATAIPQFQQILDSNPNIGYVIVDPFFLIKGENSVADLVASEYRNFRVLMQPFTQRGVNVTIVHHTNKGDHSPMNRISGTQAIKAAPETLHVISKLVFGDVYTGVLQVDTEMRYHAIDGTRYLKRSQSGHFILATKEEAMAPTEGEISMVLKYFELTRGSTHTPAQVAGGAMIDKNRIVGVLTELEERGLVESYNGKWGLAGTGGPRIPDGQGVGRPNWLIEPLKDILRTILANKPEGLSRKEISVEVLSSLEISQPSIDKYLPRLVSEGFLTKTGVGYALKPQSLPDWL